MTCVDGWRLHFLAWCRSRGRPLPMWGRLVLRWRERAIDRPWNLEASRRVDRGLAALERLET